MRRLSKTDFSILRLFGSENCTFKVVIVYESPAAAMRAEEMRDRLATRFERCIDLESDIWDFELLNCPEIREKAAAAAAAADMVIISANGAIELPEQVKAWIECWLPRKHNGQSSLVALLNEDAEFFGEPHLVAAYLREIAGKAGMDFFCNLGDRQQNIVAREPQLFTLGESLMKHWSEAGVARA
jgi:hypothetical protein